MLLGLLLTNTGCGKYPSMFSVLNFFLILIFFKPGEIIPLFLSFSGEDSAQRIRDGVSPSLMPGLVENTRGHSINLSFPLKTYFWFNPFSNSVGSFVRMFILKRSRM